MEQLNQLLKNLVSTSGKELHLEPNRKPYIVATGGVMDIDTPALQGAQITTMVFPLIPDDVKQTLPNEPKVEFVHPHNLGRFSFTVQKSPAGFNVTVRPLKESESASTSRSSLETNSPSQNVTFSPIEPIREESAQDFVFESSSAQMNEQSRIETPATNIPELEFELSAEESVPATSFGGPEIEVVSANDPEFVTVFSDTSTYEPPGRRDDLIQGEGFVPPVIEYVSGPQNNKMDTATVNSVDAKNRQANNPGMQNRMNELFRRMADVGASDLHLSVSMPPMVRKDGKMQPLECAEQTLTPEVMRELLASIMPEKNREEFDRRHDTDFAYEIAGLARFRCNVFMDRKGMGAVFRIIPTKILTAEQLGLSKAIMDLCSLSKGLVVVTGPTGSGKSTTLCAMVDHINKTREDHIITIEDPIEFVHDNQKCLVNQREVHNHTDSFKDALRAALREDPDILLVGEMRDLETISIAIETAETGHLVFGTLHTTTAASTVDRIIDQFPADRQQQIRVMLSESLKGVIAQTLLPKKGGGRIAALEVLIVTPAISNLIREGKTFQIPSAMQTGKNNGMVMLNDALFELVQKGIVEPRDAYIKAVDKTGFETMLTRGGFKI
ncbi:type IV pilus twitching motility protein PilT [Leptolyngbya sp. 7M]|uniref:type IV pilus twitching motility protein PilT n=1 Tax=Leptolyngbya sp. 7M TaxID=2812896 RepID=UPI0028F407D2|nr:type IV pilus twitching motility protein PilT [Leptolyngbya sp. 7M]